MQSKTKNSLISLNASLSDAEIQKFNIEFEGLQASISQKIVDSENVVRCINKMSDILPEFKSITDSMTPKDLDFVVNSLSNLCQKPEFKKHYPSRKKALILAQILKSGQKDRNELAFDSLVISNKLRLSQRESYLINRLIKHQDWLYNIGNEKKFKKD